MNNTREIKNPASRRKSSANAGRESEFQLPAPLPLQARTFLGVGGWKLESLGILYDYFEKSKFYFSKVDFFFEK